MTIKEIFDVTIIGGGPAGLYSAFYSGLREMKTKIIEFQPELGGKLHVYPEKMIWDVGGLPPTPGAQLVNQLIQQGLTFQPTVVLNEKAESIFQNEQGIFEIKTASGDSHFSKTILIAVGGGILKPQKLEIEGAERFEVTNLNYTVRALQHFKNKTVLISGGGNSAIDWANELEPIAKKVYLTYRKDQLAGHEAQVSQLLNSSVTCFFQSGITRLIANQQHDRIEQIELTNFENGDVTMLEVDEVIINHGYERDASLLHNSNLRIDTIDDYYVSGNAMCETSLPGIFAVGDIVSYEGKVNLIAGAFQDAVNAVNKAKQFVQPNSPKFGMVSSHNDAFKKRNKEIMKQLIK